MQLLHLQFPPNHHALRHPVLGLLSELCFLPDKVAPFLFEFHADDYESLGLPVISTSASSGDIHKLLKTPHV
jgi:hypothetical protein